MLTSQAMVLATAMAVSGTAILLACRRFSDTNPIPHSSPRPCISSGKRKREKNKKKRPHFAKDVVEPSGNNEEYRKLHCNNFQTSSFHSPSSSCSNSALKKSVKSQEIPPNRRALYNAILKDRSLNKVAYSY